MLVDVIREMSPSVTVDGSERPSPHLTFRTNLGGPVINNLPEDPVLQESTLKSAAQIIQNTIGSYGNCSTTTLEQNVRQLHSAIDSQRKLAVACGGDQYTLAPEGRICVERNLDGSPRTTRELDANKPWVRFKLEFKPSSEQVSKRHPIQQVGIFHNILRRLGLNPEDAVSTTLLKPPAREKVNSFDRQKQEILATDWKPLRAA